MNRLLFFMLVLLFSFTIFADNFFSYPEEYPDLGKSSEMLMNEYSSRSSEVKFLYNLAMAYKNEGDLQNAKMQILDAITLEPNDPWVLYRAGQIHNELGEKGKAVEYWTKALENDATYEFRPLWEELVPVAPEYGVNAGMLWQEKAKEFQNDALAKHAQEFYNVYLENVTDGPLASQAQSGINEIEIFLNRKKSEERQKNAAMEVQRAEMERQQMIRDNRESFRTYKKYLLSLSYNTLGMPKSLEFEATKKNSDGNYIKDRYKDLGQASSMNELCISVGYIHNQFLIRSGFIFGSANYDDKFNIDSTYSEQQEQWVQYYEKIKKSKTFRFYGQLDYNYFYIDPIYLYAGGGFDVGKVSLETTNDWYDPKLAAQVYLDAGLMLYFEPILFDLDLKFGLAGPTKGFGISIGALYKFDLAQFGL